VCRCFSKLDGAVDAYAIGIRVDRDKVGLHVFTVFASSGELETHSGTAGGAYCHTLTPTGPRGSSWKHDRRLGKQELWRE
jgi:hypothetical protein